MPKCKVNWDKLSLNNPDDQTLLSTRIVEYTDNAGNERKGFRMCLERPVSEWELGKFGVNPYLYVTIFPSIANTPAFEKAFLAKKLPPVNAARMQIETVDYIRFYSEDSADGTRLAGQPVLEASGNVRIYNTIAVDLLMEEDDKTPLYGLSNAAFQANNMLMRQIEMEWAMLKDDFYQQAGNPYEDAAPDVEPPITPPTQEQQKPPQGQQQRQGINQRFQK